MLFDAQTRLKLTTLSPRHAQATTPPEWPQKVAWRAMKTMEEQMEGMWTPGLNVMAPYKPYTSTPTALKPTMKAAS
ncbi:MAG: hypothetical protein ACK528_10125 [Alphaproteobacteria bacterium]